MQETRGQTSTSALQAGGPRRSSVLVHDPSAPEGTAALCTYYFSTLRIFFHSF